MEVSPRLIIYLLTAGVSLVSVKGHRGGFVDKTCVNKPEYRTAPLRGSVNITCKYPPEETSTIRYLCREEPNVTCTPLIQTHLANHTRRDRLSLIDNKQRGVYTVTISSLTMDDAGRYRCAMRRSDMSTTCLTQVSLLILNWDHITPTAKINETKDTVQIKCSYPESHKSNEKFLCKGENPFNCEELIHTGEVAKGRFTIRDNQRLKYFYVYIHNLSKVDSGTYWCGTDRTWQHDNYNKILLTVAERGIKAKKSDRALSSTEEDASSVHDLPLDKGIIVLVAVCLALPLILTLVIVLLLLVRQKILRIKGGSPEQRMNAGQNTEGNHGDHDYEEIEMQNQQVNSGRALLSVYATVNHPSDQLHYASIQKDSAGVSTDGNALHDNPENGSSACEYSSVSRTQGSSHPPAAE